MPYQIVVIENHSKLTHKQNYLIVKRDNSEDKIFIPNIYMLIIISIETTITTYVINELLKNNVKIIFCDEKKNPNAEINLLYGSYDCTEKLIIQANWHNNKKVIIWNNIVKQKIFMQSEVLYKNKIDIKNCFTNYIDDIVNNDDTNREGFAAKIYFHKLFGVNFSRDLKCNINSALNYGYSILLSAVNREVVALGYYTQLGIKHCNKTNKYNLSCDLMEPFRPMIDNIVYNNKELSFNKEFKIKLINVLNEHIIYGSKKYVLIQAINLFIKDVFESINNENTIIKKLEMVN